MKKILMIAIAAAVCLSMLACTKQKNESDTDIAETTAPAQTQGYDLTEDLTWESVDGGVEITSYSGDETVIIIPDTIDNQKVVSVGDTFSGNVNIIGVFIPEGCREFNFSGCDNLKSIEFAGDRGVTVSSERFPEGLETIIAPKCNVTLKDPFIFLKYLDVSEAESLEIEDIDEYEGRMEEIKISEKFECILFEEEDENLLICEMSVCEEAIEDDKNWIKDYSSAFEINEENLGYVYNTIFATDTIMINGTQYDATQE